MSTLIRTLIKGVNQRSNLITKGFTNQNRFFSICNKQIFWIYSTLINQALVNFIFLVKDGSLNAAKVQHPAPDFKGTAVVDGNFKEVKLSDYRGKYLVLFFYPLDL